MTPKELERQLSNIVNEHSRGRKKWEWGTGIPYTPKELRRLSGLIQVFLACQIDLAEVRQ